MAGRRGTFGTVDNATIVETNLKTIYHNGSQIGVCSLDGSLTWTAPTVTGDCGGGTCIRNDCGTQGTSNPASSCDPTDPTNTWTFETASFSEFALGLECADTLTGVTLLCPHRE